MAESMKPPWMQHVNEGLLDFMHVDGFKTLLYLFDLCGSLKKPKNQLCQGKKKKKKNERKSSKFDHHRGIV